MDQQPTLTINDLKIIMQIIKVASNRGAIQPEEMVTVGNIYAKLENFIKAVSEKADTEEKDIQE